MKIIVLKYNHKLKQRNKVCNIKTESDLKGEYSNEHSGNITAETWQRDCTGFQ